jgi:hypothetical protein
VADKSEVTGSFEAPPPGAPRELAQPLSAEFLAAQLEAAARNEQVLAPFAPQATPVPPLVAAVRATQPAREGHQPAASSGDSPSRGVPRPITDPGKVITGGFGAMQDGQYFPLDGAELREVILSLMDRLAQRLPNDLRLHQAITYPRLRVRVAAEVEAYAADGGFTIEFVSVHEKTPIEVARQYGDKVVFVLVERRQEFADDGGAEDPPDRVRESLGLERPRKQQIETPGGKMFVDRSTRLDGLF